VPSSRSIVHGFDNPPVPDQPLRPRPQPLRWSIYCRVIDNLGDVGVCWRLAADLAARGEQVRLVIDEAAPLAWMAPQGAPGVLLVPWAEAETVPGEPGDVVIEAFGCDPPPAAVQAMAARQSPPVWINLEYLSAEDWVERAHRLPSPQPNGLKKWFLFPGFSPRTGGLLREPGLLARRAAFDGRAWLAERGWAAQPGERVVLLFSYANPLLPSLCQALAHAPTLLLVPPGPAQTTLSGVSLPAGLRMLSLPYVSQPDFDHLLWSADLAFVRGEDSLVRALWAGAPFVWQAYPQHDGVHHAKVDALLARMALPAAVQALWHAWNGREGTAWPGLPAPGDTVSWQRAVAAFRAQQSTLPDLATSLQAFVHEAGRGGASRAG
jgi:uncharacterized repeat protein (TIGR03837 family)